MVRLFPALFLTLLVALPGAHAQEPAQAAPAPEQAPAPSAPPDTRPPDQIAREEYAAGEAAYARGEYAEAEAAFIRAYQAVSNPVVLIAVAESRSRLGRGHAAVEVLERYLRVAPNAPDADAVRERIDALRAAPGTLHISTEPAGATIAIDGADTGMVTPADVELAAGAHVVRVTLEGYEPVEGPLEIQYASRHEVHQVLSVVPVEVPEEGAEGELEDEPEPERRRLSPALVATMSTAAASLIAGTALGFTALSRESDFNASPSEATADEGERFALFADLAFGISIAATTTSVVLYLVQREDTPDPEEAPLEPSDAPTVRVMPVLGRGLNGGALTITF